MSTSQMVLLAGFIFGSVLSFARDRQTVVLVHGAFQDAHCWNDVKAGLEKKGFHVIVVNLPGRNDDGADAQKLTLDNYKQAVLKAIEDEKNPVVLVGHSFGGITISNVAEAAPDKVAKLAYLSAYLPQDGDSLQKLAQTDSQSELGKPGNLVFTADYKYASINEQNGGAIFGNDADGATREKIAKTLIAEPAAPQAQPLKLSQERFGKVPKYYIETTRDVVVGPQLQERMAHAAGVAGFIRIDAGHASYITKSNQVVDAIAEIAREK